MGKLTQAVTAANATRKGLRCTVAIISDDLPAEDAAELHALLADTGIKSSALSKGVEATYGVELHQSTISRHRRRDCQCRD